MSGLRDFIAGVSKCELHVHLEGTKRRQGAVSCNRGMTAWMSVIGHIAFAATQNFDPFEAKQTLSPCQAEFVSSLEAPNLWPISIAPSQTLTPRCPQAMSSRKLPGMVMDFVTFERVVLKCVRVVPSLLGQFAI
jgi:hypothetical protein